MKQLRASCFAKLDLQVQGPIGQKITLLPQVRYHPFPFFLLPGLDSPLWILAEKVTSTLLLSSALRPSGPSQFRVKQLLHVAAFFGKRARRREYSLERSQGCFDS